MNDFKVVRTGEGESDWKVVADSNETPWYSRGRTGEYLREWADFLLHGDQPDSLGFAKKAKRVGLTDAEVNQVLRDELE